MSPATIFNVAKVIGINFAKMLFTRRVIMWALGLYVKSTKELWDDHALNTAQAIFDNDVDDTLKHAEALVAELTNKKQGSK